MLFFLIVVTYFDLLIVILIQVVFTQCCKSSVNIGHVRYVDKNKLQLNIIHKYDNKPKPVNLMMITNINIIIIIAY